MNYQPSADTDICSWKVTARSHLDSATPRLLYVQMMLEHGNGETPRTLLPAILLTPMAGLRWGQAGVPSGKGR